MLSRSSSLGALILSLSFAAPTNAGPADEARAAYDRGDYATVVSNIRSTTTADWQQLAALAAHVGDTLYGEVATDRLTLIRPDPDQPVLGPSAQLGPRKSSFHVEVDITCRFALSFMNDRGSRRLRLWSMPNGQPIATLSLSSVIYSAAVSQEYLAIDSLRTIHLYEVKTGSFLRSVEKTQADTVDDVGLFFSQNGQQLFAVPQLLRGLLRSQGGRLFDIPSGGELSVEGVKPPRPDFEHSDCPVMKRQTFIQ